MKDIEAANIYRNKHISLIKQYLPAAWMRKEHFQLQVIGTEKYVPSSMLVQIRCIMFFKIKNMGDPLYHFRYFGVVHKFNF